MDLLREYGKISVTYFESTERYHGPTSRVWKDCMDPTFRAQKDTMDLLIEYGMIPWTYF
jgi:hypothetical protein